MIPVSVLRALWYATKVADAMQDKRGRRPVDEGSDRRRPRVLVPPRPRGRKKASTVVVGAGRLQDRSGRRTRRTAGSQRRRVRRTVVKTVLYRRPIAKAIRSGLRIEEHPTVCAMRKEYKKLKMRQLAAQKGRIGRHYWRKRLDRQNPRTRLDC